MKSLTHILFLFTISVNSNFIIFENIGKMATAITYINTQLTINISEVESMTLEYYSFINKHYNQFVIIGRNHSEHQATRDIAQQGEQLLWQFKLDYHTMRDEINLLKNLLPYSPNRQKRFLGLISLGLGVMGTFMGLYNTAQITALQNRMDHFQADQNRIVKTVIVIAREQEKIIDAMDSVNQLVQAMNVLNPAMVGVRLNRIDRILRGLINRLIHAFQMAQTHRMAVDFNSDRELKDLYNKITNTATKEKLTLLTKRPTDLFQIETSYFTDGYLLHLMLHVPAVKEGSLLNLLRMYPVPVQISPEIAITPKIDDNILGLSPGKEQLAIHLSSTDLLDCKTINKVFLCERHAVLHRQINDSCIGALYLQDFSSASKLCPLQTTPLEEIVKQLMNNWFLIFSPKPQTARISCNNGTLSQFYLPEGISQRHLSPGCRADFQKHVLLTDSSITIDNDLQHFDWSWIADLKNIANFTLQLEEMHHLGLEYPTIEEMEHFQTHTQKGINTYWKWFLKISVSIIISITIITIAVCCTNKKVLNKFLSYILFSKRARGEVTEIELSENFITDALRSRQPSNNPHN